MQDNDTPRNNSTPLTSIATSVQIARLGERLSLVDSGCIEFQGRANVCGYGVVRIGLSRKGTARTVLAHRLAYEIANGPIPNGMHVCHKCDNPGCCNPDHLFLGTDLDNVRDMIAKGRNSPPPVMKGKDNNQTKLTDDQVREIRSKYQHEFVMGGNGRIRTNQRELAEEYGVTSVLIGLIVRGDMRND